MITEQHKLYVPKLEDFKDINDFLKACSLYNKLIEEREWEDEMERGRDMPTFLLEGNNPYKN